VNALSFEALCIRGFVHQLCGISFAAAPGVKGDSAALLVAAADQWLDKFQQRRA